MGGEFDMKARFYQSYARHIYIPSQNTPNRIAYAMCGCCPTVIRPLKLKFTQYPAIHTNYSLSNYTISNKKDFNRSSDFLVIN